MAWALLVIAGLFEIGWAVGLKYTEGFSRLMPSVATIASMVASVAFLEEARHAFAWLRLRLRTKQREALLQAVHLLLGLLEMMLEGQLETLRVGGLRDLRQRLHELTLGAQDVA